MKAQAGTFPFGVSSAEMARGILDSLTDGCQLIAPDWTYLYVNDAAAAQAQLPKERMVGRTMLGCFPGIEETRLFDALRRCMRERRPERMENELGSADGARGWFELRFVPTPDGVCILSVDIARQKYEDARRAHALSAREQRFAAPNYAVTDLASLVRHVAAPYEAAAREECVAFTVEATGPLPALVDAEKIRCILSALLTNAFAAVPSPGAVRVSLLSDRAHAFFEVADSGAGISLQDRDLIFDRADTAGGPGGLAIARELALQQRGSIAISEAPEGGALVVLAVPRGPERLLASPVATGAAAASKHASRAGKSTSSVASEGERPLVLVIDDDAEVRRFLARRLATQYRIATARDGREGLRKVVELRPDLILTDTVMPLMTGEELVAAVRASSELSSIPILVLSAVADDELRVRLLRNGAQDYVTKPFALAELSVRVANLVQKKLAEEQVRRTADDHNVLAELGAELADTLDYDGTRRNVAQLVARALADFCILEVLDSNGDVESRKVASREPADESMAERLERWPLDGLPRLGSTVFETKQRLLLNEVPHGYLETMARGDEQRATLRELAPRAILSLPLLAHGQMLGGLTMVRTGTAQPFTSRDIALAEGLAWRAALALDNARLYRGAQHAIRTRDDVLSMVAHDLRNPLNAMLLQLRLMRRRGPEPERRSQEPLDAILREGARLNRLIGDLLDVACIEAGTFLVSRDSLSLKELTREAVAASRVLAEEASLSLLLDERLDTELRGDRSRLLQALGNLIGNAIKFTPPGGTITLRTAADRNEVRISVVDTGPGIPDEQLPHLFDRFWQAKGGDRRGAGLGLWIAKTIAEAHDGQIQVESMLGHGSTFTLMLPRGPTATQNLR